MAGLSNKEKLGCMKIVEMLEDADLFSLTETVTNRMIHVDNRKEAIQAILTYSESASVLLKRRKVHREIIFKYLAMQNIAVPPSSEKNQLIQRAVQHWKDTADEQRSLPRPKVHKEDVSYNGTLNCKLLGEQFAQWFYQLLNSQNPSVGHVKGDWGPQHFWENSVLKFAYSTSEQNMEEYSGSQMTSLRLLALVREERLLFNPNLDSQGLKCVTSPHGLVVVAVAGTVHRDSLCLGIFEQVFGLIRNPVDDNWKIKFVNLKVIGQKAIDSTQLLPLPSIQYQTSELETFYC
ncbi:uncharacterized protein C3orf38 homolog [Bombina bombina]|uniref:uncharacterized protein C3orf38 homolog n=1 Tax=Bombina bombina TaxID=8345 RepID=UPI00235A63FC|nr:uncharacterized protein C3orf38 homolog [Bombina bombina]